MLVSCNRTPNAKAVMRGSGIRGTVLFYQEKGAVLIEAKVYGLPWNGAGFYGFHIHEGGRCDGETFAMTGGHLDPLSVPHPSHAGDLPPLMYCSGYAYLAVRSDRFRVRDIVGRTVVIHEMPDDFRTQPAGNAMTKIACGIIRPV